MGQHYKNRHECALSQLSTHPDMTFDVARMLKKNKKQPTNIVLSHGEDELLAPSLNTPLSHVIFKHKPFLIISY